MKGKLKRALWLPIPSAILCWGWFKRFFCRPATRTEAKDHQAGVRRELRGLPAEHQGGKPPTTPATPSTPSPTRR